MHKQLKVGGSMKKVFHFKVDDNIMDLLTKVNELVSEIYSRKNTVGGCYMADFYDNDGKVDFQLVLSDFDEYIRRIEKSIALMRELESYYEKLKQITEIPVKYEMTFKDS